MIIISAEVNVYVTTYMDNQLVKILASTPAKIFTS